ncbi:glycosyl hydrolase 115 family protein [Pedobacter sp. MW01-1-1]|uniref:glycosyl hydrolase 115 family protein n=1 Tax=Pedobacter sp. MW01-1-1 TaxID=3383027 RepID=UPI003FEE8371
MRLSLVSVLVALSSLCFAAGMDPIVAKKFIPGSFPLASNGKVSTIVVSNNEWPGVLRATKDFQNDLQKVTGTLPELSIDKTAKMAVIIGTIGKSKIIDQLIKENKINVAGIAGKWESTLIQVIKSPINGVDSALVVAGSDKRGTIYGIYEISYQMGVSPWYYWADVPVKTSNALFVLPGKHVIASPAVKYRGIFLNDEAPALSGWAKKEFGGFNHQFYEKVFELILRLKGNYLWPAMWGSAFNDDDKLNPIKADEYGVVMGTSHHEPLSRAHDEWKRFKGGKWNYDQNAAQLKSFWETGLQRVADKEQIITVGMRGDGDEPMTQGTATALLERIVKDQREIIEKVTQKPASQTPQMWALYKEVQDYYDKGMRVPDDITLLLCDDNWGNIRKLPKLNEATRTGGYGIYYHFDYVGGPRNYKWINTNPIQKIWEQMHLAYEYSANQIWIVNVGDLKPMEFPIEFFLDYAWQPEAIPAEKLKQFTVDWSTKQFGAQYALEIADIIDLYSKYNGRIKPELLNENTYSLVNYHEFERVVRDYKLIEQRANFIYHQIPKNQQDAYYQLVLHPVEASANLNELYFTVAKNKMYAKQGRVSTNLLKHQADSLYKRDSDITNRYNKVIANGKWDHMMDQTHIGYTSWQQPDSNRMPKTYLLSPTKAQLGLAIEGSDSCWIGKAKVNQVLPAFSVQTQQAHYIELFAKGTGSIKYRIKAPDYVFLEQKEGQIIAEQRIQLSINWAKAPKNKTIAEIRVEGSDGSKIIFPIALDNRFEDVDRKTFVAQSGYMAMEAPHYSKANGSRDIGWKIIPNYGKTVGGVMPIPVTSPEQKLSATSPHLTYEIFVNDAGTYDLLSYVSPTIDFTNTNGLKFAVSVDNQEPQILNISTPFQSEHAWGNSVANNIKILKARLSFDQAGAHTLKYWMVSPGVVLQKLVLDLGGVKPSYLGPNE